VEKTLKTIRNSSCNILVGKVCEKISINLVLLLYVAQDDFQSVSLFTDII